jgi:hypothetical protein
VLTSNGNQTGEIHGMGIRKRTSGAVNEDGQRIVAHKVT